MASAALSAPASGDLSRRRLLRETELAHSDGHAVPVEIESTLILDAAGVPAGAMMPYHAEYS